MKSELLYMNCYYNFDRYDMMMNNYVLISKTGQVLWKTTIFETL